MDERERMETGSKFIELGYEDTAIIIRGGKKVDIEYSPKGEDEDMAQPSDIMGLALLRILVQEEDRILASLDTVGRFADSFLCPNCDSEHVELAVHDKETGVSAMVCEECHEGWDVNKEGEIIRQDTPPEEVGD